MNALALEASNREVTKSSARETREREDIPAIVYGMGFPSRPIAVKKNAFQKVHALAGGSRLVDLKVGEENPVKALIKDVQVHPTRVEPLHVDFYQVRMDRKMTAEIPLKFIGESPAVKLHSGTLVKSRDSVEVSCLPADLPSEIEVDLSKLETFEDTISVGDLPVPEGVTIEDDPENSVANVAAPLSEEELKKLEESQLGDVSEVKTEAEEKAGEEGAEGGEEGAAPAEGGGEPQAAEEKKEE